MREHLSGSAAGRALTCAVIALGAWLGLTCHASAEEPWGWELPKFSEPVKVVALYKTDGGHIAAWYTSTELPRKLGAHRLSGFIDLTTREDLAPLAEVKAIKGREGEDTFLAKHHLARIPWQSGLFNPGAPITEDNFAYFRCEYPYSSGFSVHGALYIIVWKRPHRVTKSYGCTYHGDEMSSATLTTRYHEQRWNWHWGLGSDLRLGNAYFVMEDVPWVFTTLASRHGAFSKARVPLGDPLRREWADSLFRPS